MDPLIHDPESRAPAKLLPAALVGLAIALAATSAWWALDSHESRTVELETGLTARQVAFRLEEYIASRLHAASALDHLWERGGSPTADEFRTEAMLLADDLGGLQALNWVDPQGIIRWVAPEANNHAALGRDLGSHPVAGGYLRAAHETGQLQLTPPIDLYQGGLGMAGYLPLAGHGTLNIVFRFSDLVEGCLSRGLHDDFHYTILDGPDLVHRCADWPGVEATAQHALRSGNREWQLALAPTAARLERAGNTADEAVLVLGLVLALLGAGLVYRLQVARRRERERERYFRRIVDTAEEGIWAVDAEGRTTFANHRLAQMLGYPPEELRGRRVQEFMDQAARDVDELMVERRQAGQRDRYETTLLRSNGHGLRVLIASAPMLGPEGQYQGALAMVSDISERRAAQEQLALAVEGAGLNLWNLDLQRMEVRVDRPGRAGRAPGGTHRARGVEELLLPLSPATRKSFREDLARLAQGEAERIETEYQWERDGERRWLLCRGRVVERSADGRPLRAAGTLLDVSARRAAEEERRDLQARVHHAQKLESLGVLTGGIAHDFNNLLTTILGHAALARGDREDVEASLAEITTAARRAAELCRQMLAYAGSSAPSTRPVSLQRRVHELESLLAVSIPKKVELFVDIPPGLPVVEADPSQLDQVLMNLMLNAAEAIGDQPGRISVTAREWRPGPGELAGMAGSELHEGEAYVRLEVEDDGCGMEGEVRDRLFEPFFTTKFAGRGLGMASVLGILRAHGGAIGVESQPGRGSCFRIALPVALSAGDAGEEGVAPAAPGPGDGRRVLVVDDEPTVRELVQQVVEECGYRVATAADGAEAVRVVEADPAGFDAIVMDITMPGLDGVEAMARVRELRPGLPVMLMSGFGASRLEGQPEGAQPDRFLAKPFLPQALLEGLEGMLSGTAPGRPAPDPAA